VVIISDSKSEGRGFESHRGHKKNINMRSEKLNRILNKLIDETDEDRQKRMRRTEERFNSLTSEYQLGYYIGEYIFYHFLPTIEIDSIHTRKLIKMDPAEKEVFEKLDNDWFELYQKTKEFGAENPLWGQVQMMRKQFEEKYLPKELICHLPPTNIRDESEFKRGLIVSLWNCDICHYSLNPDDIVIEQDVEDRYWTKIIFKLG